jgi:uncharacterized membrane protein
MPSHLPPLSPELERMARQRARAKLGFCVHAMVYAMVITGLTLLAFSREQTWSVWPAAGWGFGLLMHGLGVFAWGRGSPIQEQMIERERSKLRERS